MGSKRQALMDTTAAAALALRRRRRRLDPQALLAAEQSGPVKVNLGSGLEVAPGWINVDASLHALVSRWPRRAQGALFERSGYSRLVTRDEYLRRLRKNVFVHHDVAHSLPFADASVDFVFTSHLVEHLTRNQCVRFLREVNRVLRPQGVARIATPDLELAARRLANGDRREVLEEYFFRPDEGRLAAHQYMYDFELLREACEEAGLHDVQLRRYREGVVPDLELLDNRPDESLFVEAAKRG
jgi:predicted SAM-dependent methyltransferase